MAIKKTMGRVNIKPSNNHTSSSFFFSSSSNAAFSAYDRSKYILIRKRMTTQTRRLIDIEATYILLFSPGFFSHLFGIFRIITYQDVVKQSSRFYLKKRKNHISTRASDT